MHFLLPTTLWSPKHHEFLLLNEKKIGVFKQFFTQETVHSSKPRAANFSMRPLKKTVSKVLLKPRQRISRVFSSSCCLFSCCVHWCRCTSIGIMLPLLSLQPHGSSALAPVRRQPEGHHQHIIPQTLECCPQAYLW